MTLEPIKGQGTPIEKNGYGTLYEYKDYANNPKVWRYFSTDDLVVLRPSIEMLICSSIDFNIAIKGIAYNLNEYAALTLTRGHQWFGPLTEDHEFYVVLTINNEVKVKDIFGKPNDAIDKFFALWEQYEIGDYWAEI